MPWVTAAVWLPIPDDEKTRSLHDGRTRFAPAAPTATGSAKDRLVVKDPWPAMARTVWGDADMAGTSGWVGDLDTYRDQYVAPALHWRRAGRGGAPVGVRLAVGLNRANPGKNRAPDPPQVLVQFLCRRRVACHGA